MIRNGMMSAELEQGDGHVNALGLEPGRALLLIGRIGPEKRQLDLIVAYLAARARIERCSSGKAPVGGEEVHL
jgi:hypothetical protein